MKKILGLDLGTNSIGWAVVRFDEVSNCYTEIEKSGVRIIPMDGDTMGKFEKGVTNSSTATRRGYRSTRRLLERYLLRRERLHRVLHALQFLPFHYEMSIGWDKHNQKFYGKFIDGKECKLAWQPIPQNDGKPKYEFLFKQSFEEMVEEFRQFQPSLFENGGKIPYDWTLYYLRKKALSEAITKEELAWVILNFNQKRGYYQLDDEDDKATDIQEEVLESLVTNIEEGEADKKNKQKRWYAIHLENGMTYSATFFSPPQWLNLRKELLITTKLNADGSVKIKKDETPDRKITLLPSFEEIDAMSKEQQAKIYGKIKVKTEHTLKQSGKKVGTYIYDTLLQNPTQKIRGKLIRTIDRSFYKEELEAILNKQKEFHAELINNELYTNCIHELYQSNESQRKSIADKDLAYLFVEDIIFYQRPLKTKKHLIDNCSYEERFYIKDGVKTIVPIKCIAKSHPLFQEFRLWQFIDNLRIIQREKMVVGRLCFDVDVTTEFLPNEESYSALFEWLNNQNTIEQKEFFKYPAFGLKKQAEQYRWNFPEDKKYPCNTTRSALTKCFKRMGFTEYPLNKGQEEALWHILYSITDKETRKKALSSFSSKPANNFEDSFVTEFVKFPLITKEYGSYSAKAINKLLPLMRKGKYWYAAEIDTNTIDRINKIIDGEYDEKIRERVREKAIHLQSFKQFKGLPLWLACYVVYDRHSEAQDCIQWNTPEDIDIFLKSFKQHSLHNPIVEQVYLETLRTMRDIWTAVGQIDEIHVELGRDMKNSAKERERISKLNSENEEANLRIRRLLMEFLNPEFEIEDVRPYSPSQQEILRIYEDGVLSQHEILPTEIEEIIKKFKESKAEKQPTSNEILRYKLWLDQKYQSPYTGKQISIGRLFTSDYQIEHIIPQKRFFDDSFSNKVICESAVNTLKNDMLGFEFIYKHGGQIIDIGQGKSVQILSKAGYEELVKKNFTNSRNKMRKLLMDEIPVAFIERQLNDSRYISKLIKRDLSNIVREEGEQEAISKNLIACTGGTTDRLKQEWGINDVWNQLIYPRFERLNAKTESTNFGSWQCKDGKNVFQIEIPLEYRKGFNRKRIDHRHHAMDAIVIACTTRNHVNYLNNEHARKGAKISRFDLQRLLCYKTKPDSNGNYRWTFHKPWETFTQDTFKMLSEIAISFKQTIRILTKSSNKIDKYGDKGKKIRVSQTKGDGWAVRQSMHKETVSGITNLRKTKKVKLNDALVDIQRIIDKSIRKTIIELRKKHFNDKQIAVYFKTNSNEWANYDFTKVEVWYFTNETKEQYTASRKPITNKFTEKYIQESVTDTGIQKILIRHLHEMNNDTELAFSSEGIERMNKNIVQLNKGKFHHPIQKVRIYETKGNKFNVGGTTGNKNTKFVEAAKDTNLFFAIYQKETGERVFESIALNIVIERMKQNLTPVSETDDAGNKLLFHLSPNDCVYLPNPDETEYNRIDFPIDIHGIYKFKSCSGNQAFFIPSIIAYPIIQTLELGSNNKSERAWNGEMIKQTCLPIKMDRIGNITSINNRQLP